MGSNIKYMKLVTIIENYDKTPERFEQDINDTLSEMEKFDYIIKDIQVSVTMASDGSVNMYQPMVHRIATIYYYTE